MGIQAGVRYAMDGTLVQSLWRMVPNDAMGTREGRSRAGLEVWR